MFNLQNQDRIQQNLMGENLITNISSESKYYSFLVVTTWDKKIAGKWDYYVLSVLHHLLMDREQPENDHDNYQYNIGIDAFACQIEEFGVKLILSEGDWLKACLTEDEIKILKKAGVLTFKSLSIANQMNFYYYISKTSLKEEEDTSFSNISGNFLKVQPKYIVQNDCLIFQMDERNENSLQSQMANKVAKKINYKILKRQIIKQNEQSQLLFNFKSDYAMLSDLHFLNCFVRGKKSIGFYTKQGQQYLFAQDSQIKKILNSLYTHPRL